LADAASIELQDTLIDSGRILQHTEGIGEKDFLSDCHSVLHCSSLFYVRLSSKQKTRSHQLIWTSSELERGWTLKNGFAGKNLSRPPDNRDDNANSSVET